MKFEFIETSTFSSQLARHLTDDEYTDLQVFLCQNPSAGVLVKGSGGIRKLRWVSAGSGKSGGVRVCYYLQAYNGRIWMLTLYKKSERDSIPAHILRLIAMEIEHDRH